MDRRGFLGMMIGGIAASAAVRTFPFRVFSFPSVVKPVRDYYSIEWPIVTRAWEYGSYLPEMTLASRAFAGFEFISMKDYGMDLKVVEPPVCETYAEYMAKYGPNGSRWKPDPLYEMALRRSAK
jgi:hypothetical protein